jgi:hypothetical protein
MENRRFAIGTEARRWCELGAPRRREGRFKSGCLVAPANDQRSAERYSASVAGPAGQSCNRTMRPAGAHGWGIWDGGSCTSRPYSAAMRSHAISRYSSLLAPVRRGGGVRIMRSPSKRTPRT